MLQLRSAGQPVPRLETPAQRERDSRCTDIVRSLARLDLRQPGAAERFLSDVAKQTREARLAEVNGKYGQAETLAR